MCKDEKEYTPLDALNNARKAQQKFDMNNDIQLEIDFENSDTISTTEFAEKT